MKQRQKRNTPAQKPDAIVIDSARPTPVRFRTALSEQAFGHSTEDQGRTKTPGEKIKDLEARIIALETLLNLQSQFVSDGLARIVHDFKGPLTVNRMVSVILHDPNSTHEERISCLRMNDNANAELEKRLEEILICSKLNHGKLTLHKASYDIVEQARDFVDAYSMVARRKKKELLFVDPRKRIPVFADRSNMNRVLENIVLNAIEFGREKILISLDTFDGAAFVSIADDGPGMTQEGMKNLFELFASTSENGNGIGLANAKEIVELHNGRIGVGSVPGLGSNFLFMLPVIDGSA